MAARTPCALPPTTLQPRVSARSEAADACRSPASNCRPPRIPATHACQSGRRWTANAARNLFGSTQGAPIPRRSRRARLGVLAPMPISCALRACFLGAQCMQPRVSARSESANACRSARLERQPASNPCHPLLRLEHSSASNHSHLALRPERQALDSERSAEHIWLHARRATFLPPPCSRESPREVSRPMPAAPPPRTTPTTHSAPRAADVGQRTQRGAYLAARTPCDLPPTTLQPRVSARSESSDACRSS